MSMENVDPQIMETEKTPRGLAGDFHRLKTGGAASFAELREFVGQMRGRRPQEVLGLVAASRLMGSIVWATIAAVVVVAAGSAGPYYWNRLAQDKPAEAAAVAEKAQPKAAPAKAEAPKTAPKSAAKTASAAPAQNKVENPDIAPDDAEKAVKIMGVGDTKMADPRKNPLEDKLDNLLDTVK